LKPDPGIFYETSSWEDLKSYLQRLPRPSAAIDSASEGPSVAGFCYVCDREVEFRVAVAGEGNAVNWRETLDCPECGLSSRSRGSIHAFDQLLQPRVADRIYLTEQLSPIFSLLLTRHPFLVGSEYRAGAGPGEYFIFGPNVARNEDLTALSFADRSLHHILTFDVLEHIPDYRQALRECFRVLKPGGKLLISVPFNFSRETEVRARIVNGEIEHLLDPIYHGDPLHGQGILCFHHFGMDFLDELTQVGFVDCKTAGFFSREWGYFVPDIMFRARKR
jgi:SAM-dependent methyltransferase